MGFVLIFLPLAMAGLALAVPSNRLRPWLVPLTGVMHAGLTAYVLLHPEAAVATPWLILDPLGRVVLVTVSGLFLFCSFYTVGYLRLREDRANRIFCACMLAYLGLMTLVIWSQHLGLMWVGIETTALAGAPLIYFNRTPRSIEATWKYLLVGSIGVALALLGSFFLAYAMLVGGAGTSLTFPDLVRYAPQLSKPWLHAAFVLLLVGYGTKMGLAPMHTWKPDAYGEAPGVVGALFAGGVTNCSFLALMRLQHISLSAGEGAFSSRLLIFMGLLSMAVAGIFMVGQRDFKRMLAYSSVEAMGILVMGLGIGGAAIFGTLLHVINNSAAKGVLFLSAGNIHRAYGSKSTEQVAGALRALPLSGMLFLAGFIAIVGSPPFGPFISEFTILSGAFDTGQYVTGGLFLFLLLVIFMGMGTTVLAVVQGRPKPEVTMTDYRDGWFTGLPPLLLMALVLLLGLSIPEPLYRMLKDAEAFLRVTP